MLWSVNVWCQGAWYNIATGLESYRFATLVIPANCNGGPSFEMAEILRKYQTATAIELTPSHPTRRFELEKLSIVNNINWYVLSKYECDLLYIHFNYFILFCANW